MTQMVAVYRPHLWAKPTGVVWWDAVDSSARCMFTDDSDRVLAMDELVGAQNQIQFDTKVGKLAARTPRVCQWDSAEISVSPDEFLALLQKQKQPA